MRLHSKHRLLEMGLFIYKIQPVVSLSNQQEIIIKIKPLNDYFIRSLGNKQAGEKLIQESRGNIWLHMPIHMHIHHVTMINKKRKAMNVKMSKEG